MQGQELALETGELGVHRHHLVVVLVDPLLHELPVDQLLLAAQVRFDYLVALLQSLDQVQNSQRFNIKLVDLLLGVVVALLEGAHLDAGQRQLVEVDVIGVVLLLLGNRLVR